MAKYEVKLKSTDKHEFLYTCEEENTQIAIIKALQKIEDKGWEHYRYHLSNINEIK